MNCWTLNKKALCPFETSVTFYHSPQRNIAEVLALHQHHCENLLPYFQRGLKCPASSAPCRQWFRFT